jgi:hypothetical protein
MQTAPSLDAVDETSALDSAVASLGPFNAGSSGLPAEAYPLPAELLRGRNGFTVRHSPALAAHARHAPTCALQCRLLACVRQAAAGCAHAACAAALMGGSRSPICMSVCLGDPWGSTFVSGPALTRLGARAAGRGGRLHGPQRQHLGGARAAGLCEPPGG